LLQTGGFGAEKMKAKAAQQADIAMTIKVQVTVDVGEAELFLS
jgi:hypothetical protein